MRELVDKQEKAQVSEEGTSKSYFSKLLPYNRPRINIFFGFLASLIQGSLMPFIGAAMSKMLFILMDLRDYDKMR